MLRKYANRPVYRRHDPRSMQQIRDQRREESEVHQQAEGRNRKARLLGRIAGGTGGLAIARLLSSKGLLSKLTLQDLLAVIRGSQGGSDIADQVEQGTRRSHRHLKQP